MIPLLRSSCTNLGRAALATLLAVGSVAAQPQAILPVVNEGAQVTDRLGSAAALDTVFLDESGQKVTLRSLVDGTRPVLLNLGYFECPRACGPIYHQIVDCLQNASLVPGRELEILSVSIDHEEGPDLAAPKRDTFLEKLGHPDAAGHWHFLTSPDEAVIREVADSVGYGFEYQTQIQQYDHAPVVVMLSPDGVVTRYLNGLTMTPVTFKNAVVEAGQGTVGSFLDRVLVSCLTFDPSTGEYTVAAMTIMQVGGAITVLALGLMIFVLWRRERVKPDSLAATTS